jgi:hypothetical protein
MLIPGIYILLLLAAAVVLAFVLEVVLAPAPASGDGASDQKLDRRVFRRLAVVSGAAALAVMAAIIAGYSVNREWTSWVLAWPGNHPSSLLLVGVALFLIALLCGVKPRQPELLLCLTLPGLVIMPLLLLPTILTSNRVVELTLLVSILFVLQPGILILLLIGIGQARVLHESEGNFTPGGLVRVLLISVAYLYGIFF